MLNIILRHWFLVNLIFQLPKFEDKDEDEDNFSTKSNLDLKCKGSVPSPQGELFDLDNLPQMQ